MSLMKRNASFCAERSQQLKQLIKTTDDEQAKERTTLAQMIMDQVTARDPQQRSLIHDTFMSLHKQGATSLLAAHGKKDIKSMKMALTKKSDALKDEQRKKEQQLQSLYTDLEAIT